MDENTHWRDSARVPKLFIFDYRLVFFYLLMLFIPALGLEDYALYIFLLVLLITIFFYVIENFKFTLSVTFRWLRNTFLAGNFKKAKPWW